MVKRKETRRRFLDRLRKIPHLFAKVIIIHCIVVVTISAFYSLYAQRHGADMVGLYTAISASFVTELAMLLLKTILKKTEKTEKDDNKNEPSI